MIATFGISVQNTLQDKRITVKRFFPSKTIKLVAHGVKNYRVHSNAKFKNRYTRLAYPGPEVIQKFHA